MGAVMRRMAAERPPLILSKIHFAGWPYSTLLPGPWAAADGLCWHTSRESHPSEDLSELPPLLDPGFTRGCGWTGVSLLPDGIIERQLVQLFCERMGTARHLTLAVFYAGNPHRWVLAHPPESLSAFGGPSGNVFQSPDMTGSARCFSRCAGGTGQPPHYLSRVREGVARKNFNFPSFF